MVDLPKEIQVVIIGGGQASLAVGYYLKRTKLNFVILDDQIEPGGAWLHTWRSLKLFSPGSFSSLPGWLFPQTKENYPTRDEVICYLKNYEERYQMPIHRPVTVSSVTQNEDKLTLNTNTGTIDAQVVINCTGTWGHPYIPSVSGQGEFVGQQLHSAQYVSPEEFTGKKILIVGGGNSGAQILAEISKVAITTWVTQHEPFLLPDDVDGRVLFQVATQQYQAQLDGRELDTLPTFGDIVMIDSVKDARNRGCLHSDRMFSKLTASGAIWPDGSEKSFDTIIWCTGFRPNLEHLKALDLESTDRKIEVKGTRSVKHPRLWFVGYGDWTGFGSATLIGVQRYARSTVNEVQKYLGDIP